jgi:hypothetical protein
MTQGEKTFCEPHAMTPGWSGALALGLLQVGALIRTSLLAENTALQSELKRRDLGLAGTLSQIRAVSPDFRHHALTST